MGCWQKPAEIWTEAVHDPMNLLDNAIVGSRIVKASKMQKALGEGRALFLQKNLLRRSLNLLSGGMET